MLHERLAYIALQKCHCQGQWFQSKSHGAWNNGKVLTLCCKQFCKKLKKHLKLKGVKIMDAKNNPIRFGPVNSWKQRWRDTSDRYEKYTEAFHIPPGCVAVPDDKHKKHGPAFFETLGFHGPNTILPSCYMTFKSKCWDYGFRTCQKQQHSCLRKIITYASWPKKFLWKSVHRAPSSRYTVKNVTLGR